MGDVVEFRCARAISDQCDADAVAEQLIAEFGPEAGYRIGYLARYAGLPLATRIRLLRIGEEVDRRQGFGWWFADNRQGSAAQER